MDEGAELGVEEGTGHAVTKELGFDGVPDEAGGGTGHHYRVDEVIGECRSTTQSICAKSG